MAIYSCLYRRQNARKNKSWECDGYVRHANGVGTLLSEEKELVTRFKMPDFDPLALSKREFSKNGYDMILQDVEEPTAPPVVPQPRKRLVFRPPLVKKSSLSNVSNGENGKKCSAPAVVTVGAEKRAYMPVPVPAPPPRPISGPTNSQKQAPQHVTSVKTKAPEAGPFHLPPPPPQLFPNESFKDVVLDASLNMKLRDHQKEGLAFLYSRVMGFERGTSGAVLADDMGMGKTLQTISLIWTLLCQSPFGHATKSIGKVLICCPVSLVNNWKAEFPKWLGINRCPVLALTGSKYQDERRDVQTFAHSDYNKVLIVGYEKMVSLLDDFRKIHFDLLVCDEGHRLKSSGNKTLKALESLGIRKRVLLSGTPIQNDLAEFYTIANFVSPGALGDFKEFQKEYMIPILKSRDPTCINEAACALGKQKSLLLIEKTKSFVLRRDNKELHRYLPPRTDYFVMVQPSLLQLEMFKTVLQTDRFKTMLSLVEDRGSTPDSLSLITTFRKLCNSPSLLKDDTLFMDIVARGTAAQEDVDFRSQLARKVKSGKLMVLVKLVNEIVSSTDDKLVIVSNFTSTLDIIATLLEGMGLPFLRLDGSTPASERQPLVNRFNKSSAKSHFAFLLSSKAGGVGLNLTGANRLVMFDNDWNPAVDSQSLARIHRDGQTKPVFVYRLITKGCIDEKILQRQVIKQDLANTFVDGKGGQKEVFDRDTLLDVFKVEGIDGNTTRQTPDVFQTHEMMGCECDGMGYPCSTQETIEEPVAPQKRTFVNAFDYSQNDYKRDTERDLIARQQRMCRCFTGYRHINAVAHPEVDTNDTILNSVLSKQGEKVLIGWIFAKF